MASDLLDKYGNVITKMTLIPSNGGVFEVQKNGKLVFSKKQLNRFPELQEIVLLIE